MDIPSSLVAAGWIPFSVVVVLWNYYKTGLTFRTLRLKGCLVGNVLGKFPTVSLLCHYAKHNLAHLVHVSLTLVFSWFYIYQLKSRYDHDRLTVFVSVLALSVALYTTFLIPVDVFLVSFMKDNNGTFKDWAMDNLTRNSVEDTVLYAYYALYGCMGCFIFLILPFVYFLYEERDEMSTLKSRICGATKFTLAFLLVAAILVIMGSVIPLRDTPPVNSTEFEKFEFIIKELGDNKGEDILSFILSVLSVIGLTLFILYGGYGLSAFPCGLMKGMRSISYDFEEIQERKIVLTAKAGLIRDKYADGHRMTQRDQSRLYELEEEIRLLDRRDRHLTNATQSWLRKCLICCRPLEMIGGVAMTVMGLLLFISLLLTNIDKAMHSLGAKTGYVLPTRSLPNPIDIVLVFTENLFPFDYVLFTSLVVFCFFCTMSALKRIGIWFLWIRMYRIRYHRTRPQGILMICMSLMFMILAINIVMYSVTPQYMMYGSQQYWDGTELKPCSTEASNGECTLTRIAMLLVRLCYKTWVFGAIYYWGMWILLGVVVLGSLVSMFKKPSSVLDNAPNADDFDESDEELLRI